MVYLIEKKDERSRSFKSKGEGVIYVMNKKAFTLVEIALIVIVIAILAAIAIPQFINVQERTIVSQGKQKLDTIRRAQQIYRGLNQEYTNDFTALADEVPPVGSLDDADWVYTLNNVDETSYEATATRQRGAQVNLTIIMNEFGEILGSSTHPFADQ